MCDRNRNLLISLEGNIGSGKSTLLDALSTELRWTDRDIAVLPEPVQLWDEPLACLGGRSMLGAYYEDGTANSFAFQMFVLKTRLDQVLEVPVGCNILSERCMHSHDLIFACGARARGQIGDVDWVTYRGWVQSVSKMSGERGPYGVIYLRTSPRVCSDRRRDRDRESETDLPDSLLEELHTAHEAYIKTLTEHGVPVLMVDGDVDASESERHDQVRVIVAFVEGLIGH